MTQPETPVDDAESGAASPPQYTRRATRGNGVVVLLAVVVSFAVIAFAVSWNWTQRSTPHGERVLAAQRGGYESAELRFCLGIEQVAGGVGRAEAALAAGSAHDLKLAVSSIQDGYVTAKAAAVEVPHASVDGLTQPRNSVRAVRDRAPGGLPAAAEIGPSLHDLALAAATASNEAVCGHVLSIGSRP